MPILPEERYQGNIILNGHNSHLYLFGGTTNGEFNDSDLCSKLTGILIKTEPKILLQIISNTQGLYNSLKDVLDKLVKAEE